MQLTNRLSASVLLAVVLFLQGCSSPPQDRLPTPRGSVPVEINPGEDTYTNATAEMITSSELANPDQSGVNSEDEDLAKDLCDRVGTKAIEYSIIAAEESGGAYIARVLEAELVQDNRDSAQRPEEGGLEIRIECRATVELSTGDKGSVTLYELLDSNNQVRVRWENYEPL